jgi:predicted ester cyclase
VADGQIAEAWAVFDTVGLLQQLDVWPGSASPANAGPASPPPGTPPDPDSVATVERFYAAFATGDMDTMAKLQPDWDRRNYIAWQRIFASHHTIEDVVAAGDLVVARGTLTGTQIGAYGAIPPTGRAFCIGVMDLWRVQNGQLTESWGVWDNFGLTQQLLATGSPTATPSA